MSEGLRKCIHSWPGKRVDSWCGECWSKRDLGEEKPDGWVATNVGTKQSLQGFIFIDRQGGQGCEGAYEAAYRALRNHLNTTLSEHKIKEKFGLVLTPVKLQFTDEQGEGWISVNERLPEDSDFALDVTFYSPNYLSNGGYWVEEDVYFANGNWCRRINVGQYLDPYKPIQMNLHEQKVVAWKKHVTPKPYIPTEQKEEK